MGIFGKNRHKTDTDSFRERPVYVEPTMDRELPLALFAAVVAAIVLVGVQMHASSAAQKKEAAAMRATYSAVQHRADSRLASSQLDLAGTFEQRIR